MNWHSSSRSINQPLRVFLSLSFGDFFVLLFIFGVLQVVVFLVGFEPIYTLILITLITAALVRFRFKHPKTQLRDFISLFLYKLKGGIIYEPSTKRR